MGLGTASTYLKIGVLFSFLAALCHTIGFATHSWRKNNVIYGEQGLWQYCNAIFCGKIGGSNDEFRAIRAMETIGLIFVGAVFIAAILFVFLDSLRKKSIRTFLQVGSLAGCVFILIGVIIFGVRYLGGAWEGSYSFGLSIVGAIFALLAAILFFLDRPR